MAVIHIVLFKFERGTSKHILNTFVTELRKLKKLPCVHNENLVVGGPSITTPIARSKGYDFCLVSYHKDRTALDEYQASAEHHHVTSKYMWPFNEDLTRFDFEVNDGALESFDTLVASITKPYELSQSSTTPSTTSENCAAVSKC